MSYSRKQSAPWAKDPASARLPSRPLPRGRLDRQAKYSPPPRPSLIAQVAGAVGNLLLGSLLLGSTATAAGLVGLAISFRNLPDVHQLRDYVPIATTHIVDIRGEPIASLHGEANREVISVEEVSPE
ncbi:MAG: penicillin-binding protein, partial [Cyanobacteriota bacterium]